MLKRKFFLVQGGFFCGLVLLLLQLSAAAQVSEISVPYTATSSVGPAPLPVLFNSLANDSYGNRIIHWSWNFGDGATSISQNPFHIYTNNGIFVPVLQAVDANGGIVTGIGPSVTVGLITGLVSNGGFETGTFTNWTVSGDTEDVDVTNNPTYAHSGTYGAQLGPKGDFGNISQNLPTLPGVNYWISFWLDSPDGKNPNEFLTSWDGSTLMDDTNLGSIGWTNVQLGGTATQSNTVLQFDYRNDPSWFGLDEIDVEALVVLPASQTVECGSTVTLSLASNNVPAMGYLWYNIQNAVTNLIASGTNSVLTLTNVSAGPVQTYVVVVSNANGSFTSSVAAVTVVNTTPPVITLNSTNLNPMEVPLHSLFVDPGATANGACAGTNVTLSTNNPVNVNSLGTYFISYIATDLNGNSATNFRIVDVIPDTVTITSPTNGNSFSAPANVTLSANANLANAIQTMVFYTNGVPAGTNLAATNINTVLNGLSGGSYQITAVASYTGFSVTSAVTYVTVNVPGTALINFDPLADLGPVVGNPALSQYLAQYGVSLTNNSPGTTVVAENQASVAGGGFVTASSQPNLLTQIGSIGPVSFTVGVSNLLSQFSFTRPALLANPFVTHPAWQAQAFDPLGRPLAVINVPQIFSSTNVPAQTYTLTNPPNGGGIASIEFNSEGTGLTTFNAMLLDDFLLTVGSNLPPSILITSPTNGQVFTTAASIPINAATAPGSGIVTNVDFYTDNILAGSLQNGPFSFVWSAPSNGPYFLTAVAVNNANLSSTSAPVAITVANGFAIVAPPTNQTVGVSNSATFSVIVNPTNGISYQWLSNGIPIDGANLSTYTVGGAQNSVPGSNSYNVVVTSGGVSLTSQPPAVLTVLGPPTLGPISLITNGSNITLSVSASDSVPFYYQWLLNGNGIPGATNSFAAGTNTISYTITNAQPFDSGNYQVVVANIVAAQESPVFAVAVAFGTNTPVSTNVNFASSLNLGPLTNGVGVVGINSSSSVSPANGPAQIAAKPAAGFLWYNWTASFTGVVSMTTRGSSFDTLLGVYTGSYPGSLVSVGEDDDSGDFFTSLVTFNCVQGTTYQIVVAGYKGATGNVVLALSPGPPLLPGPVGGYSIGAPLPVILQQPASQIVNVGDTVTLSVTASNAVTYQWYFANTPISSLNTNILVTNTPVVAGVSTNYLIIKNFPTNAVGNYYVMVGTAQSESAAVELQDPALTVGSPPFLAVDKFNDAVDLTAGGATGQRYRPEDAGGDTGGFTLSQSFSTMNATKEEGEPNHAGQPGGASYWYSYTAPGSGSLRFDTIGSTFNTILAVYTGPGTSFSTLTNVGAAYTTNYVQQGQPVVVVTNVTARKKYFIAIDGYLGASGAARLNVILTNAIGVLVTATNTQPVVSISSPKNNYLTTSSNVTFKGTVRGVGNTVLGLTSVQLVLNGNAPVSATLGAPVVSPVLITVNGGVEEAAAETIPWTCTLPLVPGANYITTQAVSTNNGTASAAIMRNVFFVPALPSSSVKSTLTLSTSGSGKITGLANGASLEVNNIYKVAAVPVGNWLFTNWTSGTNAGSLSPLMFDSPALTFVMSSNLILQANFVTNPFTAVAGVYNGLFSPATGVTEESSGFFTATIPASSRGNYSAKLLLNGGSYPFTGSFDLSGKSEKVLTLSDNSLVAVILNLNLTAPDDMITGMINNNVPNSWSSDLLAERAVFSPKNPATNYAGKFTLIVPPDNNAPTNEPGGFGYATLANNPNGLVTISGQLGDGTAISQSVPVARDGNIPLYVSLYSRQGSFQGWVTVANNPSNTPQQSIVGNDLSWIKLSSRAGTLFSGGFTNTNIITLGSAYLPPQAGANALALTNGTLTISNGNLGSTLVYSNLTIVNNKLVNNDPNNPPNPLSGVITPDTGVLTVTFRPTGASANTVAKGVVLQDTSTTNGAGWFLGAGQTGYFLLQQ